MKQKVYIAGKLNADAAGYLQNVSRMIRIGNALRKRGFSVYIPCMDLLAGLVDGKMEYKDYFENNLPWLLSADILYVMKNSTMSVGTQQEIEAFSKTGKRIVYEAQS